MVSSKDGASQNKVLTRPQFSTVYSTLHVQYCRSLYDYGYQLLVQYCDSVPMIYNGMIQRRYTLITSFTLIRNMSVARYTTAAWRKHKRPQESKDHAQRSLLQGVHIRS